MNSATLVQATADVITVVSLKKGDVYKRLVKNYGEKYEIKIGVVQDVLHNGTDAVITALEFEASYSEVKPEIRVFGTDTDLKLFAATPDEVRVHFEEVREASKRLVRDAGLALLKRQEIDRQVEGVLSSESVAALTAPETTVTAVTS